MISKKDEETLLEALKLVDVKSMEIDHNDQRLVKWFRFGSYNGMIVAANIIQAIAEKSRKKT